MSRASLYVGYTRQDKQLRSVIDSEYSYAELQKICKEFVNVEIYTAPDIRILCKTLTSSDILYHVLSSNRSEVDVFAG